MFGHISKFVLLYYLALYFLIRELLYLYLRIDNSGWSVNFAALFDIAVMKWYQKKYYVLYNIRKPIINSVH